MVAKDQARAMIRRHPAQRLQSPSRGVSAALHIFGLAIYAWDFYSLTVLDNPQINNSYGWHFQFLTIIGLALATATFALGLIADMTLNRHIFLLKNTISVLATPLEVLISVLYWGLRLIDKKLVMPDWAPPIPFSFDAGMHIVPAVTLATDLLFFSPPYTIAAMPALTLTTGLAFAYWFWIEQCFKVNGFYPYPIFEMLNTAQRVMLFAGSGLICTVSLWGLQWIYGVINPERGPRSRPGDLKKDT